jgi:transposase
VCWRSWMRWSSGTGRCWKYSRKAPRGTPEVARRYGVVRHTVHTWLRRYAEDGLGGLADWSPRPASCPHQMPAPVEARIVAMRRDHPGWGPSRIRRELERAGVVPLPGRSAVCRALVRHGLV